VGGGGVQTLGAKGACDYLRVDCTQAKVELIYANFAGNGGMSWIAS